MHRQNSQDKNALKKQFLSKSKVLGSFGWRCFKNLGLISVGLLVGFGMIIGPLAKIDDTFAVADAGGDTTLADGTKVDLSTGGDPVASSISITMGGTENGQLNAGSTDPNKSAGLVKRTASVQIGATDGYSVTISGNPNLTGINSNNKIPTVTTNTTLAQMNNQWGWYSVEGNVDCSALQTMKQMKTTGEQIASGVLTVAITKQYTMCFGAKVNGNQAADTYSNTVTLSVVAQPHIVRTFGGIDTMQKMTTDICKAAKVNDAAYLRDTRDNKSYWVTKLADGNCWMSQNLAFDMSGIRAVPKLGSVSEGGATSDDNYESYSWKVGDYVIKDPVAAQACADNNVGLSGCSEFVQVGNRVAAGNPNFYRLELYEGTDGSTCTKSANTTISTATSGPCAQYDAHYLVGNYYSYAATANICPAGWTKPSSSTSNNATNGSFYYLLNKYGLISSTTGSAGGASYNIAKSPLFFVRSGVVGKRNSDTLGNAGVKGLYWSSNASSMGSDYGLSFDASSVSPSNVGAGFNGRSLRCLVVVSAGGAWDL